MDTNTVLEELQTLDNKIAKTSKAMEINRHDLMINTSKLSSLEKKREFMANLLKEIQAKESVS